MSLPTTQSLEKSIEWKLGFSLHSDAIINESLTFVNPLSI